MATKTLTSKNTNFKGNSEADSVTGSEIADSIFGGIGQDSLFGNSGNDTIDGGNDNDVISGGADDDSILGGNGIDSLSGDDGDDTIDGGAGNDTIDGGTGADSMVGGDGDDTYYVDNANDVIIESSTSKGGKDTVIITNPLLTRDNFSQFVGIENFIQEGETDVQLSGDNSANTLTGNAGNNYIFGNGGNDTLFGLGGNDTLEGGKGIDDLNGGEGDDTYIVSNTEDTIIDDSGVDTVQSSETITIVPYTTVENLTLIGNKVINGTGNDNDNTIEGNDSDNKLDGGKGDDTLIGGDGNDTLIGGDGNDSLDGGNGEDDVALYKGSKDNFSIKDVDGVWSVINIQTDEVDELKDIEFVQFDDDKVQLETIGGFDTLPIASVKDVTLAEGNKNGSTKATVTITLDHPSTEDVTVELSTEDGTAVDGEDYEALNAETITFAAGETSKTARINIISDLIWEEDENFIVVLDNAQGAEVGEGQATVTITNDDKPTLSIVSALSITEGEKGKANAEVTVSLSSPVAQEVTVSYKTTDGTAKSAGQSPDFTNTKGTLTFKAGEMTKKILVPIADDKLTENNEEFRVTLSNAKGALLDTTHSVSKVTILDNDAPAKKPVLSVTAPADPIIDSAGDTEAEFIVSLSAPSTKPVTVKYATANGTAKSGSDFDSVSDTLTFAPGETELSVFVPIFGDSDTEGDETFSLKLSGAKEATLGKQSAAKATITDGDSNGADSSSAAMLIDVVGVHSDVAAF